MRTDNRTIRTAGRQDGRATVREVARQHQPGQTTYRNPFWPRGFADPFVLKVRGHYYAYATEDRDGPERGAAVFPILASPDLVRWREVGRAMPALGAPYRRYWAPEVTAHNGRFLLYYAVHTDEFRAGIRVAVAERPDGPFHDSGRDLTRELFDWAIDPHVFRDVDGRWYLYMTVEYVDGPPSLTGSGNAVVRLRDPLTVEGLPARVTAPSQPWQLFEARRAAKDGVDWYTVEGPAVLRHRGRYYEMFSGGCYYHDNYAVSYATAEAPMGPGGMRDASWRDWAGVDGDPRLMKGIPGIVLGPGHNSVVRGPNNADLYLAYHAWPPDMSTRQPYLDRLFWHGAALWTDAPTHTPQPLPAPPRLRAFGDPDREEETASLDGWSPAGGRWVGGRDEVSQTDGDEALAALYGPPDARLGMTWLLEVNLCRRDDSSGAWGVLLHADDRGQDGAAVTPALTVTLDGDGRLAARLCDRGGRQAEPGAETVTAARAPDIGPTAWRQLLLSYAGSLLHVELDGQPVLDLTVEGLHGRFALLTERCGAAFSGVTLTDHYRDEFLDDGQTPALLGWTPAHPRRLADDADWRVCAGSLAQTNPSHGIHLLLKGSPHERYEFGGTVTLPRLPDQPAPGDNSRATRPLAGLIARRAGDAGSIVVGLVTHGTGVGLVVEERRSSASPASILASAALPAHDPAASHTLRLVRRDGLLTVHADGPAVLAVSVPGGAHELGLYTRDTAAAFTGVWLTAHPAPGT